MSRHSHISGLVYPVDFIFDTKLGDPMPNEMVVSDEVMNCGRGLMTSVIYK
jgi:hypothetical protein